jgi:hypothetical protein
MILTRGIPPRRRGHEGSRTKRLLDCLWYSSQRRPKCRAIRRTSYRRRTRTTAACPCLQRLHLFFQRPSDPTVHQVRLPCDFRLDDLLATRNGLQPACNQRAIPCIVCPPLRTFPRPHVPRQARHHGGGIDPCCTCPARGAVRISGQQGGAIPFVWGEVQTEHHVGGGQME